MAKVYPIDYTFKRQRKEYFLEWAGINCRSQHIIRVHSRFRCCWSQRQHFPPWLYNSLVSFNKGSHRATSDWSAFPGYNTLLKFTLKGGCIFTHFLFQCIQISNFGPNNYIRAIQNQSAIVNQTLLNTAVHPCRWKQSRKRWLLYLYGHLLLTNMTNTV